MDSALRIFTPFVVGEVLDGEAVIMDLRTGHYFSATGAGAWIWQDLEAGRNRDQILQSLAGRYDLETQALVQALDGFLAELLANDLLREAMDGEDLPLGGGALPASRGTFEPPALTLHTDLKDLLLLDPIHDVDAAGWPTRKK